MAVTDRQAVPTSQIERDLRQANTEQSVQNNQRQHAAYIEPPPLQTGASMQQPHTPYQPNPEPPHQPVYRKPITFNSGLQNSPIVRTIGSEYHQKFKETMTKFFQASSDEYEIWLGDLDKVNESDLAFSALIVGVREKAQPELGVAFHILLLEATGQKISPVIETYMNTQIEVMRSTSEAIDKTLINIAAAKVAKAFPYSPVYFADGCVVPSSFVPDDMERMQQLALNAGLACGTELTVRDPNFVDINLKQIKQTSPTLSADVSFTKSQILDATGLPVRSDAMVSFISKLNTQQDKYGSLNQANAESKISEISAFVDVVWVDEPKPLGFQPNQGPYAKPPEPKFMPRLVITNISSYYAFTIGSILTNIYTAFTLSQSNAWIGAFKPSTALNKEVDFSDIGALNIEANIYGETKNGTYGTRIDTKSSSVSTEDINNIAAALFRPSLLISLDIPESGPQSWYLSAFAAAANDVPGARDAIINAANAITGNLFSNHFGAGEPIFATRTDRIHNGYWKDNQGTLRDIRDIDYLAVANQVGNNNPQYIREWSDTFVSDYHPPAVKLHHRKKMIQSMTGETAVFTGFSQRVTFSNRFLKALETSIASILQVRLNTPLNGEGFNMHRGAADYAAAAGFTANSFTTMGGFNGRQIGPGYNQYKW